jgi:DNA-binding MarR family transcriptional regulator
MTSRTHDPDTSIEAAELIREHVPRIQYAILAALSFYGKGMTTRELSQKTAIDFATVTPRMKPMEEKGWVQKTPVKVKNPQGKGWGRVWLLTPLGRKAMIAMRPATSTTKTGG